MTRGGDAVRSLLLPLTLLVGLAPDVRGLGAPPPSGAQTFDTVVKPFLTRNCYLCHGARLKNADVDLEAFETAAAIVADPEVWEKAIVKMRTRQMPPPP